MRVWLVLGAIATVLAVAAATLGVVSLVAREERVETTAVSADGLEALRVDTDHGLVEVLGDDVDEVTVRAEVRHGLRRTKTSAEVEDDTLVLDAECPIGPALWCAVDYRIVVPANLDVHVGASNGRLVLRDVDGAVEARGRNGAIELVRLGGGVDARSSNGSIDGRGLTGQHVEARSSNGAVRLRFADAPTTVTARTSNGAVEVVVPDDGEAYHVELDSDRGATDTGVRTDPSADRTIVGITRNGAVTVRYPTG